MSFISTTTTITGAGLTVTGVNHRGDAVTQGAKAALVTAYNTAAREGPTSPIVADLASKRLTKGVYKSASFFQAGSSLTTGSGSRVNLINGARSCNVFWQIGSSATLGTGSKLVGTVMADQSITVTTGAEVVGRVLARNGAVTLDTNKITRPTPCTVAPTPTTTTTPTTTPTPTTPTSQQVPTGAVSTGDGSSTSGGGNDGLRLLAGVMVFAGVGGAVVASSRRRRLKA